METRGPKTQENHEYNHSNNQIDDIQEQKLMLLTDNLNKKFQEKEIREAIKGCPEINEISSDALRKFRKNKVRIVQRQ